MSSSIPRSGEDVSLLDASCRVAFAALLQELAHFAGRAGVTAPQARQTDGSADVATSLGCIQSHAPQLFHGDLFPFSAGGAPQEDAGHDTLARVTTLEHPPTTLLQAILTTAARLATGQGNPVPASKKKSAPLQIRLQPLLEQIRLNTRHASQPPQWRYRLQALTADSIFPQPRQDCEPGSDQAARKEYHALWQQFIHALEAIPGAHRRHWPLWLDHFDTALLSFTHAIPAATASDSALDVSLYDHGKTSAALAVALWRWELAQERNPSAALAALNSDQEDKVEKFLLIQGDFFGIQDFIFADGSQTRRNAARLLRGRSFQVSLFTELAALKVLDALELPPISQLTNAAGKFLIVAPNTADTRARLGRVREELNAWFLEHSFGLAGLGLATQAACSADFATSGNGAGFRALLGELFARLERAKLQRFDLACSSAPSVFQVDYPHGACRYNDRLPADRKEGEQASAALSRDQILIGKGLPHQHRLLVLHNGGALSAGPDVQRLEVPIFGYTVAFTADEDRSGKFGNLAANASLARCWDFSLPESTDDGLWHGYARRYINAFVPHFSATDVQTVSKYRSVDAELDAPRAGTPKTLDHLACEDQVLRVSGDNDSWQGQVALTTLKGDVDNLGSIFQQGLQAPTFARMAALSRQMNAFFAVYLPALAARAYPNTYTVFAGGDDFFLIGPWYSTQKLAARMAQDFAGYVAGNPEITFSAGMCMTKPGLPMHTLAAQAEEALDAAKAASLPDPAARKNALVVHGERVRWPEWHKVQAMQEQLDQLRDDYQLSTSYVYSLLHLIDLANDPKNPEHAMWRSRFAYRTRRYVVDKIRNADPQTRAQTQTRLATVLGEHGLARLGTQFRIPLFNHFYRQR